MADGVAADDQRIARRRPNAAIQIVDDFSGGTRASGGECPAVTRQRGAHLKAPASENVERRVVVLDQLVAPLAYSRNVIRDFLEHRGDSWVEDLGFARETPAVGGVCRSL